MARRKRRRLKRSEMKFSNFETVLALPERLAQFLRLWFHLSKADWDFALDKMRQGKAYREWSKSKGRGRRRYFAAPCEELKLVQRAVLDRFLSQVVVHFCRHGGARGSSIMSNVQHHAGFAKEVFAVDIVSAFPSVFRSRVRACLKKPFGFGLRQFQGIEFSEEDRVAMLNSVVDLLVFKDRLPQGPPTSPRVFDIVCGKMDQELFELVQRNSTPFQSYRLTIWLDNVTISSDGVVPKEVREQVVKTITDSGFFVHTNEDKMALYSPDTGRVPVITGLVVGPEGAISIAPRKVNQLRGRLARLCRKQKWDSETQGEAAGILGFVRQVYPQGRRLPSKIRELVAVAEARLNEQKSLTSIVASAAAIEEQVSETPPRKRKGKKKTVKPRSAVREVAALNDVVAV